MIFDFPSFGIGFLTCIGLAIIDALWRRRRKAKANTPEALADADRKKTP